jgi:antitoxin (DNA-binding transcriptional repressor) of toxin-antitoxin stability system
MSQDIPIAEFAAHVQTFLERVASQGESFVLVDGGRRVVELGPAKQSVKVCDLPAFFASLPHLDPADAEQFARDLEEIRAEANRQELRDPWQS